MRVRTIKLGYDNVCANYHVLVVKGSTDPCPGNVLRKREVDELIESPRWEVTIVALKRELA